MKKSLLLILILCSFILTKTFAQDEGVQGIWNGTASLVEKFSGPFSASDRHIDVTIKDNIVTGTHKYKGTTNIPGDIPDECFGTGPGELTSVTIRTWDSTYDINILSPECKLISDGGNSGTGGTNIGISNQRLQFNNGQLNTTILRGTETFTKTIEGFGTYTTTITWFLTGSLDAQLIVTPNDYNRWMPEATGDELRKGSLMNIGLKVQDSHGGTASLKAVRFELKLSNTSREKGTTLNMPLSPSPRQLPDLRFIPDTIAESVAEDQYIETPSPDGKTGKAFIASYDGGGWTTLTAVAVLEGGIRIEGTLLSPTGVKEIPIPKRNGTSKIASFWLSSNGNPGEMDDQDKSTGNTNDGDGLTAYEEYRGVISIDTFHRLKPKIKELGVQLKKNELRLFDGGINLFESASGLKVIKFSEDEILPTRELNKNAGYSHSYDQYVLKLEDGSLPGSTVGQNEPTRGIRRGLPKQSDRIVIDVTKIQQNYQYDTATARAGNEIVPYTGKEKLDNTVAHEMGHGVNLIHHGDIAGPPDRVAPTCTPNPCSVIYRIYDHHNHEILNRPIPLDNAGAVGSEESGDLSCIMAYTGIYQWAFSFTQGQLIYHYVTYQPVGKKLCTDITGTGINKNNEYFGNASSGNCLGEIKLK